MIETIKKSTISSQSGLNNSERKAKRFLGLTGSWHNFKTIVCKNGKTEFLTSIYTDDNGLPLLCYIVDRHRSY